MEKKTKIVATISDLNCTKKFIRDLYLAGMDVVRLNTAHQKIEDAKKVIDIVRSVSDNIPILIDTKGPEVRTCAMDEPLAVVAKDTVKISGNQKTPADVFVNYKKFVAEVPVGSIILVDDGDIELTVRQKKNQMLYCTVQNEGFIKNKKSVNVPGVSLKVPALSEKDKSFIRFAGKENITFIAHSFVRNKKDVLAVQRILDQYKSTTKIIAKIENEEGVTNCNEILDYAYGIMIARGDLGVEMYAETLPGTQKHLIEECIKRKRPVIVATQMLHSMVEHPRPTRAEVSDVANAIYDGADAVMLSGETAYGKYPVKAVEVMARIAQQVEMESAPHEELPEVFISDEIGGFLAKAAVRASFDLPIKAIITDTATGRTARYISAFRGKNIVYAQCYKKHVMRELALSYGVYAEHVAPTKTADGFVRRVIPLLLKQNCFKKEDLLAIVAGNFGASHGASFIEISTAKNLLGGRLKR